ncbi:acyl-CoA thioesterase [Planctomycetales bacterium ZRK34]|nr:acyl-CoA thioesterase [Planctomycetales bacterium ZRK34]
MISEHTIRRRVEFSETDMAGIVHFSQFFRYMEAAEHDLFRSMGTSVVTKLEDQHYGWPRVHAECDYLSPLKFEDEFDVRLRIDEVRSRSIVYAYEFVKVDGGKTVARGSMTTVCVQQQDDGTMCSVNIPTLIAGRLGPAAQS